MKILRVLLPMLLLSAATAMAQVPPRPQPGPQPVPAPPQLGANSYILMDYYSRQVLVDQNSGMRVEPASITKVMTAYVVFQELAQGNITLDETVAVSERAWRTGGSRMFIEPSMTPTVEELLHGMVIQSGNDASVALAEHVAGTEEAFSDLMNHYAEVLGMTGTHFMNATGLPHEQHYTTARDVALLSIATIRDFPEYYDWYSEKEYTFNEIRQHNRNTLLWRDPAIDGLKTGHTDAAGYCLAASAMRDGMRLVSAVMGSASESSRASESQSLLNYGFRFFETVQLYQAGDELSRARVWKGLNDDVPLGLAEPLFVTIPRGRYDDLEARVELEPELTAPLEQNSIVGTISVRLDDGEIASRPLIALEAVEQAGFVGRTWDGLKLWVGGLLEGDEEGEAETGGEEEAEPEAESADGE
ncbi:D-alanyl-D-alanine carboxypeptidase family protein [Elongatibacter sediminis]|uniref:serine-type D-Ala-D-Ala carboxypeptidase n=1 Tax=Elongatibacter sediminis TaxID=3119006 RepID=A0AAW9RBI8_9GAMM